MARFANTKSDIYPFFFFNDTATTEIYTLSLHDALPIYATRHVRVGPLVSRSPRIQGADGADAREHVAGDFRRRISVDRKSTRLNSSHLVISYAVFCLKKKRKYSLRISS